MVKRIDLYIEGDRRPHKHQYATLREGFATFLEAIHDRARQTGGSLRIILCGATASRDFVTALQKSSPDVFIALLVDSEGPLKGKDAQAFLLKHHLHHVNPQASQCHLMVECMEAWFLADKGALQNYYGQSFHEGRLPANPNVEQISKHDVLAGLKNATRNTPKGEYHKTKHAPDILRRIDPRRVRQAADHCNRLFQTLEDLFEPA